MLAVNIYMPQFLSTSRSDKGLHERKVGRAPSVNGQKRTLELGTANVLLRIFSKDKLQC